MRRCLWLLALLALAGRPASARVPKWLGTWWSFSESISTFLPNEHVVFEYDADTGRSVPFVLYRMPLGYARGFAERRMTPEPTFRANEKVAFRKTEGVVAQTGDGSRVFHHRVDIGRLRPGIYAPVWTLDGRHTIGLFQVTRLGTVVVPAHCGVFVFSLDLETRRRLGHVHYVVSWPGGSAQFQTDQSGTACLKRTFPTVSAAVGRANDGATALFRFSAIPPTLEASEVVAFQTDRRSYRASQKLHYFAVFRRGAPGAYGVAAGRRRIELRYSGSDEGMLSQTVTLDRFGTASGSFDVPDSRSGAATTIDLLSPDAAGIVEVDVARSRGPTPSSSLEPSIRTEAVEPYVRPGDRARFKISVAHAPSIPLANATIDYEALWDDNVFPYYQSFGDRLGLQGFESSVSERPHVRGVVTSDREGRASFDVPIPSDAHEHVLNVIACLGIFGEMHPSLTCGTASTIVTSAAFYLRLLPDRFFVQSGEDVVLRLEAFAYAVERRVATPVTIAFASLEYDAAEGRTVTRWLHERRTIATSTDGPVEINWRPPHGGLFEIAASVRGSSESPASTVWFEWVTSDESPSLRFNAEPSLSYRLYPQRSTFEHSREVKVLAISPRGTTDTLLLTTTENTLPNPRVVHLNGQLSALKVPIAEGVPRATAILADAEGDEYTWPSTRLNVASPSVQLCVRIHSLAKPQSAGGLGRLAIDVTNGPGHPIESRVALGMTLQPGPPESLAASAMRWPSISDQFYRAGSAWLGAATSWSYLDRNQFAFDNTMPLRDPPASFDAADLFRRSGSEWLRPDAQVNTDSASCWAPSIVTDAKGHADVKFTWPSVAGTYTLRAFAVSRGAALGDGFAQINVTSGATSAVRP